MIDALQVFTLFHVLLSLVGIGSGFVVIYRLIASQRLDRWTAVFLATTVATSATGFGFPVDHFMPSHAIGILSLVLLAGAIFALYARHLGGAWRWVFVICAVAAQYLDFLVLIVQSFLKVPALNALAPTQSEPPFAIAQLAALAAFVVLGIVATIRFKTAPAAAVP